jgi:poly-gamma-glutamate synthesis protein (capsule biosynthesis protein)
MSVKLSFWGDFVAVAPQKLLLGETPLKWLKESDYNVCNFESPIEGDYMPFNRQGPRVKQPKESIDFLGKSGFNVFQLANNHMCDFGEEGCKATIDALSGFVTIGAGTYNQAYSIKIVEKCGIRVGFLACVHHEFGVLESINDGVGTAWICNDEIVRRIIQAKSEVDYLIILPHAGVEEMDAPLPEWRDKYRFFIDCGADAVIGTHPHVPQGWEEYKGKPIFYSLGDFYFDYLTGQHPYWSKSLVVNMEIRDNGSMKYDVHNVSFANYKIDEDNNVETKQHNQYLCDLLHNNEAYINYVNEQSLKLWYEYNCWLTRGLGSVSFKLHFIDMLKSLYVSLFRGRQKSLLENCLQCESHRWTILRAQKLIK